MFVLERVDLRGFQGDIRARLALPGIAEVAAARDDVDAVRTIVDDVRSRGDAALRDLTERFDGCRLDDLQVPAAELESALPAIPAELREALEYARDRIVAYHERQRLAAPTPLIDGGLQLREVVRPVERVGCYVPGGLATYPSTVLMTVIPARVAGVREIALCVPPAADGRVPAPTLAAAALLGVDEVYRVGGAQAIAALAFGTESIRSVDVVVGPGNRFVALAKREVAGVVGIDSLAGPSELVVVADASVAPELVAADLAAQAEHGPGGVGVVVSWEPEVLDAVDAALQTLLEGGARRGDEIEGTLRTGGRGVVVADPGQAAQVVNAIAPEHVELLCTEPEAFAERIQHAGAVFCGPWAPVPVGDYVAGVNHVLPTGGTARFADALRVDDFLTHMHVVSLDEGALERVMPYVQILAGAEGLDAHAAAVSARGASR